MKNKIRIYAGFVLAIALVSPMAHGKAQVGLGGKLAVQAPKPKENRFKGTISSYFYNFEGTQGARDVYEFADTTLRMELLTLQYQATPKWTWMVTGQRLENYVETNIRGFGYFEDTTKGFGDTILQAMYLAHARGALLLMADVGVSLPTGHISLKNQTPSLHHLNYPYNMQMGSGTYDAIVGVMPVWIQPRYQVGGRFSSTIRTGENGNGYRLGNLYRLDAWADYELGKGFAPRLVGYYKHKDPISGADRTLGRSALTEFYHHNQINWDVSAALRYKYAMGDSKLSVAAEVGAPIWQGMDNSDNVVVSTQYYGALSLNGVF